MVRLLAVVFLSLATLCGLAATTPADVYLDMESGLDGALVTSNLLNSATHGVGGSWTTFPHTLSAMRVTTDFEPLLGSQIFVDGTMYSDQAGTRVYAYHNTTDREFARFTFDETHSKVSMGCFLHIGDFNGSTFGSFDLIAMEGDDEFAVVNFQDFPGDEFVLQIHTQAGTRNPIRIQSNTTYWVTLLWDQPGRRSQLKVYDATSWELVGSGSIPLMNEVCRTVCFGRYDDHDATPGKYHYYDDLIIDYSAAEFPILPSRLGPAREPINILVGGAGTVTGAANRQLLEVGRQYMLTAKPAAGYLFAGWSGSTSSPTASLTFVMASNLTYTANFVPNPFLERKGVYTGLFLDAENPAQQSSGFLQLTLTASGSFSAKASINGRTFSASGMLAVDGSGPCVFKRSGTNGLNATFVLDLTNALASIAGSMAELSPNNVPAWTSPLLLRRSPFVGTNSASTLGRYTLCILPDTNAPASPQGESYATVYVSAKGRVSSVGVLADGTRFTQGTHLGGLGEWPLYLPLYKSKGSLVSAAMIDTNQLPGDIEGAVLWFKQAQSGAKIAPGGFTNVTTMMGSCYRAPGPTQPLLDMTTGSIDFSFDNNTVDFTNALLLTPQHTLVNQSANKLSLSVSKSSGKFSGSVVPPTGGKGLSFSGVVLQRQNLGAGFVLATNRSGNVILGP